MKLQPQNIEAEQAIIGSMLLSAKAAAIALSAITPVAFYDSKHKAIMEAATSLFQKQETVDLVTVANWLQENGKSVELSYLSSLCDCIPSAAGIDGHCRIVKNKAKARELIELASATVAKSYDNPIDEVIEDFGNGFFKLAAEEGASSHIKDIIPSAFNGIVEVAKNGNVAGVNTGFIDVDRRINGLGKSDLIILAARPSMGKTTFALNMTENVAAHGKRVMFFSLEMSKKQLANKMLASRAQIPFDSIRKGQLLDEQWQRLNRTSGAIAQWDMVIDDTGGLSITELTARAKVEHIKKKLDLVVVDYLQLMRATAQSREQEISAISRGLKGLAKALDLPVVALSQLNRGLESREDKRPRLSDLRESGAIEQDADVVMFIYRDAVYMPNSPAGNDAEIITAKQRNGPTGVDKMIFRGEYSRFENKAKEIVT